MPAVEETGRSVAGKGDARARSELANLPLFEDLDPDILHSLIRCARVVSLDAGELLFRQGDPAGSVYVVIDGAVVPIAEGERRRKLAVLERGDFFGEIGLLTGQPRNATVEAIVDSRLVELERRPVWSLLDHAPEVAEVVLRLLRARLLDRQLRTNLLFAAVDRAERPGLARQLRFLEVEPGRKVLQRGRPPEGLYVVLAGTLRACAPDRSKAGRQRTLGRLAPGDVFGGLDLIAGRPAEVDLVAIDECWLALLGEGRFRRVVAANPALERVLRRLEARHRPPDAQPPPLVL
jgi:CRP-like cAMP-binding protein